jgi:glucose/arabinose dehydrogenase
MRRFTFVFLLIGLIGFVTLITSKTLYSSEQRTLVQRQERSVTATERYGKLPLSFEPNQGQFDRQFAFASIGADHAIFLEPSRITLKLRTGTRSQLTALAVNFRGAKKTASIRGADKLPGVANYYRGGPEHWITRVPMYERVIAEGVYAGIDAAFYGNQNRFEYDFIVNPGSTPAMIDLAFEGASTVTVDDDGDLLISVDGEQIRQVRPIIYQEIGGRRIPVEGAYVVRDTNRVGFTVGSYDQGEPLVIDPQIAFSIWGDRMTFVHGIAVDSAGNTYVAGDALDAMNNPASDAYIAKINAAGTAVLYRNVFGATHLNDVAQDVAVDASGNAYVTGFTQGEKSDVPPEVMHFPTINPIQPTHSNGFYEAFVTKFNADGTMVYSTALGGTVGDFGNSIALDTMGNIYVAGYTQSSDFPTSRPFQSSLGGDGTDAFLTVLTPQGSAFVFSTYIGGSRNDSATSLAVDASGNSYVTGTTQSTNFPIMNAIEPALGGDIDSFILKMNPAGSALHYSTYLGGSLRDTAEGVAVDSSGNAFVVGTTTSDDFPTVNAYQSSAPDNSSAFVTKVNSSGSAFSYSTYLSGTTDSQGKGIAVDAAGNAYVTGAGASGFPQVRSMHAPRGINDAFITKLSPDGSSLIYSTLFGGTTDIGGGQASQIGFDIAVDASSNVYVTGDTSANDFPHTSNPTSFPCCSGFGRYAARGVFIAKLTDNPPAATWTRVEETDSAVRFTGSWNNNASAAGGHSGSTAKLALETGARATFTFTGTAARWIAYRDEWSGIAKIYIDGTLQTPIDTYASPQVAAAVVYTTPTLAAGTHTLTIEVTTTKSAAARSAWVWVDAFEYISGGTPPPPDGGGGGPGGGTGTFTRVEQNNSAVTYTGAWYTNNGAFNSGGSAALTPDAGARANFTFTGTDAKWIGYRDAYSGIAKVYVDGTLKGEVDAYSASDQAKAVLFSVTGLAAGTHTLTIEVAGTKSASSRAPWIWIDAFEFASGSESGSGGTGGGDGGGSPGGGTGGTPGTFTRVQQNSSAVTYSGMWNANNGGFNSGGSAVLSIDAGARATFAFTGAAAKWIGYRDLYSGIAKIYVDGTLKTEVDAYSASDHAQAVQYTIDGLSSGPHTLTVEVTGRKNASARSAWIWLDGFEFAAAGSSPPDGDSDGPGARTPLPEPFATPSVPNRAQIIPKPASAQLKTPQGFTTSVYADGLLGPRSMVYSPNGDLFVSQPEAGTVLVLRDTNSDGIAETRNVYADALGGIFGLAFQSGYLYLGLPDGIYRTPYTNGDLRISGAPQKLVDLPVGGHNARNLIFSRDGRKMYVAVGSASNNNDGEEPRRAAISEYNADGTGHRIFASGLRNPVGLALQPGTDIIWTAVNERDALGDDLVPDYITSVIDGGFYGWPYSYIGQNYDPAHRGKRPELVQSAIVPDVLIQAHSAALGVTFYTGTQFPERFRNGAFVSLHGSWNRSTLAGYRVAFVPFQNGRPSGPIENFVTGWIEAPGNPGSAWGRPVAAVMAPDGSLLVSDDGGHKIWRVRYTGN